MESMLLFTFSSRNLLRRRLLFLNPWYIEFAARFCFLNLYFNFNLSWQTSLIPALSALSPLRFEAFLKFRGKVLMSSDFKPTSYDIEEPFLRHKGVDRIFQIGDFTVENNVDDPIKQESMPLIQVDPNDENNTSNKRLFDENQSDFYDRFHENQKHKNGSSIKTGPLLSGICYCISSCSMILLNKIVLSSYDFDAGVSLMLYQNLISVAIVVALGLFGIVSTEKLTWKLIRVWVPVNIIFVGMLVTGMFSLKYINVAMVTILKNLTNILTAIGEMYLFRKRQNVKVWVALFLMIASAVSGGITDLSFDAMGYTWQIMNCILTASYSLILRRVMDTAKQATQSGSLNEVSMVLLNNLLSLPFGVFLITVFNEWEYVYNADVVRMPMFWVVSTASGVLGLAISFTSMWFLKQTSPTTYSLVGSLNKIPISVAGIVLFKVPVSLSNLFSILFGLFAGVFFARAKMS